MNWCSQSVVGWGRLPSDTLLSSPYSVNMTGSAETLGCISWGPWLLPGGSLWEALAIGGGWEEERTWAFLPYLPLPWEVPHPTNGCIFPTVPAFDLWPWCLGSGATSSLIPLPPSVSLDLGTIMTFCYSNLWVVLPCPLDFWPSPSSIEPISCILFHMKWGVCFPGWCLTDTNLLEVSFGTLKPSGAHLLYGIIWCTRDFSLLWEEFFSCCFERDKYRRLCIHWKFSTHQISLLLVCMVPASQGGAYLWEVNRWFIMEVVG